MYRGAKLNQEISGDECFERDPRNELYRSGSIWKIFQFEIRARIVSGINYFCHVIVDIEDRARIDYQSSNYWQFSRERFR